MQQTGEGVEPSRAELRRALAEMTGDILVPTGFGLSGLYMLYTIGWLLQGLPGAWVGVAICAGTATAFLVAALWLRRHPAPPKLTNAIATGYGAVVMANSLLNAYYDDSPTRSFNILIVLIGFSVLVRSLPYMLCFVVAGVGGWLYVAHHAHDANFDAYAYPIVGAAVLSVLVNAGFRRTAIRLERARYGLRRAAELDPLTGLYNRRGFRLRAERIREAANRDGTPFTAMFVDIDRMKEINDRFGHAAGDAAITTTAELLRQVLRSDDPAARLGGDEFCALLTAEVDRESIRARIMEILGQVNQLQPHPLSLSVGFADYDPASPCSIDELLQSGDIAMYEHKRSRSGQTPSAFGRHAGTA